MRTFLKALQFPFRAVARATCAVWRQIVSLVRSFRFWVWCAVGLVALLFAYYVVADRGTPLTNDAFAQAYVVQVAPQVAGKVIRVLVQEGDTVADDALLFELDPRPFEHQVALLSAKLVETQHQVKQWEAQRAAAEAQHAELVAEAAYARAVHRQEEAIFKKASTTERKYLDAVQKLKVSEAALEKSKRQIEDISAGLSAMVGNEHASVAQVRAQLNEAQLNLAYTKVHAPCNGTITNLQLREGTYAHVGQAVLACIDTSKWYIVANFRERSLEHMRPGQPALVAFQGIPGQLWQANVTSIGWGAGQGQGVPSGMLPDIKRQTSWIPLAQRFQVRLTLEDPQSIPLRVGMTGSVSVYVADESRLNSLTEFLHSVLAWFYYL